MSASTDPLIGTVVAERYRVDRLLGEGGMGKVYAAEHVLMKKRLAIKALHPTLCKLPDVVARFEREAMAAANIDHPNIAAATDFGRLPDGSLFLVLELVVGTSLRDEIAKGAMALDRALHIARQIATALAAAHAFGIVHRDLKPENVMLVSKGDDPDFVKVLDFGVAKMAVGSEQAASMGPLASGPLTKLGEVFGTPEYMSPEQALGQSVDGRADLYALGVILYEMLSGVRPYGSENATGILGQQLAKPVPSFSERAPAVRVPPRVEQLVRKLLSKELAGRVENAGDAVQALDELLQPTPGAAARIFTLTDGSPTAFFGSPAPGAVPSLPEALPPEPPPPEPNLHPPPAPELPPLAAPELPPLAAPELPPLAAPEAAPAAPLAPPQAVGPGGTLLVVEPERADELATSVAEARAGTQPKPPGLLTQSVVGTRDVLTAICDQIDASRSRLPAPLRKALSRVPASAMLTFGLVVVVGGMLTATVTLASIRTSPGAQVPAERSDKPPSEASPDPDPVLRELEQAKHKGHAALQSLAEQHPKSAPVLVELAASHAAQSNHGEAVDLLGRALELDSKLNERQAAADLLAEAVRKPKASEAALDLLEEKMGAAGARVLYDLSVDHKVLAALRARAERWVRSNDFQKVASPEIQVAAGLRYGRSCSDRHALLSRAGEVGDKRALAYLKIMRVRTGCGRRGRSDCFSCLRKDDGLAQAIASIEKRVGDQSAQR
jgi:eukaryotic-like serine/threonine-protein kinase